MAIDPCGVRFLWEGKRYDDYTSMYQCSASIKFYDFDFIGYSFPVNELYKQNPTPHEEKACEGLERMIRDNIDYLECLTKKP